MCCSCAQGEAQKIEKVLEVFARHYCVCNAVAITRHFNSSDTLFLLAYAVVMLNTDLHSRSVRADKKMKLDAFIQNLAGAQRTTSTCSSVSFHCTRRVLGGARGYAPLRMRAS